MNALIEPLVLGVEDPDKARLIEFFRNTPYDIAAAGFVKDRVTGEYIISIHDLAIIRDGFDWSLGDLYHFEKYDAELNPAFREYALSHQVASPQIQPSRAAPPGGPFHTSAECDKQYG